MTSSFQFGIWKSSPSQSNSGSWTTALPTELVTSRAYGSIRVNSPNRLVMWNRYSSPTFASPTSAYQYPSASWVIGAWELFHSLNVPITDT